MYIEHHEYYLFSITIFLYSAGFVYSLYLDISTFFYVK